MAPRRILGHNVALAHFGSRGQTDRNENRHHHRQLVVLGRTLPIQDREVHRTPAFRDPQEAVA